MPSKRTLAKEAPVDLRCPVGGLERRASVRSLLPKVPCHPLGAVGRVAFVALRARAAVVEAEEDAVIWRDVRYVLADFENNPGACSSM
jgi:hypothetical protein